MACYGLVRIKLPSPSAPPTNFQRRFGAPGLDRRMVSELPAWFNVMELSLDSSETSVITRRLIRPSVITTGVKLSEIPNFLKADWVVQARVIGSQEYRREIGNSPPAMNVADSPEIAVSLVRQAFVSSAVVGLDRPRRVTWSAARTSYIRR